MSAQLAEAEPVDLVLVQEAAQPPASWFDERAADDDRRMAAWGVIIAVMISCPFWVLIGVAIWWLCQ
jgi:hypothetical protein